MKISPTSDCTIPLKAAPMITPTARSATLPRTANSRNSFSIALSSPHWRADFRRGLAAGGHRPRGRPESIRFAARSMGLALTPMGRLNFQPALRIGVDPAFFRQAAGEGQCVGTKLIGDLQLDFAVGRRGFDRLPKAIILFWSIKRHATPKSDFPIRFQRGAARDVPQTKKSICPPSWSARHAPWPRAPPFWSAPTAAPWAAARFPRICRAAKARISLAPDWSR